MENSGQENSRSSEGGGSAGGGAGGGGGGGGSSGLAAVTAYISTNRVTFGLFCSRLAQLMFALVYFLSLTADPMQTFRRSLVAGMVTSLLRLHQRVPGLRLSRQCVATVLAEDAAHYLIYCLLFGVVAAGGGGGADRTRQPLSVVLVPLTLFSLLHSASYALRLLNLGGWTNWRVVHFLVSLVEHYSQRILHAAAMAEILIMPYTVIALFYGGGSLVTPFIYYRFLVLRYSSRRNPYCRSNFRQLRLLTEQLAGHSRCPAPVSRLLHRVVGVVCHLCPQPVAAQ